MVSLSLQEKLPYTFHAFALKNEYVDDLLLEAHQIAEVTGQWHVDFFFKLFSSNFISACWSLGPINLSIEAWKVLYVGSWDTYLFIVGHLNTETICCFCKIIQINVFLDFSFLNSCHSSFVYMLSISLTWFNFYGMLRAWNKASHFSDWHNYTLTPLLDDSCQ